MSKQFYFKQFSLAWVPSLNGKTVLFQTIQFSISTQFSSIWPIDWTLSHATTLGQSGPGSDGNEGVLHISHSFSITRVSPSDCLVSYSGDLFGGGLTSLQKSSRYIQQPRSNGPRDTRCGGGVISLCRKAVGVFYTPPQPIGQVYGFDVFSVVTLHWTAI